MLFTYNLQPKPKTKKQLLAEQRRREKEMEKIAVELEKKKKEDEEKEKVRKQVGFFLCMSWLSLLYSLYLFLGRCLTLSEVLSLLLLC